MLHIFSNRFPIVALIASTLLVLVALSTAAPTYAAGIVTNCGNDTDFSNKLAGGGVITFNCGTATITLSSTKTISANTTIDGENKITLSGANSIRLFQVNSGKTLDLRNLVLAQGYSGTGDVSGNGGADYIHCGIVISDTGTRVTSKRGLVAADGAKAQV